MLELQKKVKDFDKQRNWDKAWNIKDLSLNICEEIGELWSFIKWVDIKDQKKIISDNKIQANDFIGDVLFLILKMANQMDIDAQKALLDTLAEYETRMPTDIIKKVGHANNLAGGHDIKEEN